MSAPALDPVLHAVLRACLALLFGFAAAHKLRAPRRFAAQLADYRLLPPDASLPAALALAAAELCVALWLAWPGESRAAGAAAALLLLLYAGAIAINLRRGRTQIDCGCGLSARPLGADLVVRNALLAGCALATALPLAPRALGWVDAGTIAGATAAAALVFAAADGLAARRARWAV
jgi:hypothetical protein